MTKYTFAMFFKKRHLFAFLKEYYLVFCKRFLMDALIYYVEIAPIEQQDDSLHTQDNNQFIVFYNLNMKNNTIKARSVTPFYGYILLIVF